MKILEVPGLHISIHNTTYLWIALSPELCSSFKRVPSNFQNTNFPLFVPPTITSWENATTVKKSWLDEEISFFSVSHWFRSINLMWEFVGIAILEPFGCHPIKGRKNSLNQRAIQNSNLWIILYFRDFWLVDRLKWVSQS